MTIKLRFTNGHMKRTATVEFTDILPSVPEMLEQVQQFMIGSRMADGKIFISGTITEKDKSKIEQAFQSNEHRPIEPLAEHVEKKGSTIASTERSRQLPMVNHERTLGITLADRFPGLAELIAEAADAEGKGENKPGLSGIKFSEDGAACLKVRYFCKNLNCQKMGIRYVADGSAYCKCAYCNTKLKLRPASAVEPQFNTVFFIGDTLYVEGMNE